MVGHNLNDLTLQSVKVIVEKLVTRKDMTVQPRGFTDSLCKLHFVLPVGLLRFLYCIIRFSKLP